MISIIMEISNRLIGNIEKYHVNAYKQAPKNTNKSANHLAQSLRASSLQRGNTFLNMKLRLKNHPNSTLEMREALDKNIRDAKKDSKSFKSSLSKES